MRKLKTKDIMIFARVIKNANIKGRIKEIVGNTAESSTREAGFEVLWGIFDALTDDQGEKGIYEFLSGPFEVKASEIENMELPELIENLKILAKENDIYSFFKLAGASMK